MELLLLVTLGLITYLAYRVWKWYFYFIRPLTEGSASLTCPPKHWLFGNLIDHPGVCEECLTWWADAAKKCGKIFRLFHGPEPQLYLAHPETAKEILRSSEPKPVHVPGYGVFVPWLGMGLPFLNGQNWQPNRQLLTPAFHFDMLKSYLKVFNQTADRLVEQCSIPAQEQKPFDVYPMVALFALDTICRCAFSYDIDIQGGESQPIVTVTHEAMNIAFKRLFNPIYWSEIIWWLSPLGRRFRAVCREYNDISRKIISQRKCETEQSVKDDTVVKCRHDFLEIVLKARDEDGNGLTEDEIRAEVNTFLFGGLDTSSSAISWTLFQLGKHPEYQEKCRAEIEEIMKGRDGDEMKWEDLSKLNYLTMCMKETMRLNSTFSLISRITTKEHQIDGHVIPKGMLVNILLSVIHRQPDVWEEPEIYRPERFHPDEVAKRDNYAFVPFSAGPRNCIGQNFALNEMRVVLAKLIRNFRFEVDETRPPKMVPEGALLPGNGMWLTFKSIRRD